MKSAIRSLSWLLSAWVIVHALSPSPILGQDAAASGAAEEESVHGSLRTRYRARRGIGTSKNEDLFQYLDLRFGKRDDPVSGAVYVRGNTDLQFRRFPGDPLRGLEDSFADPEYQVYYGYVDLKEAGKFDRLRAGRQSITEMPGIYFDGLRIDDTVDADTSYSIYGGQSVHLYEDNSSGDSILGLAAEHRLNDRLRLRLDLARIRDRFRSFGPALPGSPVTRTVQNIVTTLSAFYGASQHLDIDFRATRIDDSFQSLRAAGSFRYPEQGLYFTLSAERQPDPFSSLSTELSPFLDVIGPQAGYSEYGLQGYKTVGDFLEVTFGTTQRDSDSGAGGAVYNQDFSRYSMGLFFPALMGVDRATFAVNYDRYMADRSEFGTIGGELGYRANRDLNLTAGSAYSLYEFDPLTRLVRDHVREYYVAADWKLPDDWRVRSRFVVEPFQDGETFRTLELSVRYDF